MHRKCIATLRPILICPLHKLRIVELRRFLLGKEFQCEPPRKVVHDALRKRNFRIRRHPHGLKTLMDELLTDDIERHSVLQIQRKTERQRVHDSRERGAILTHRDENFSRSSVLVHPNMDVAIESSNAELMSNGHAFRWKLAPQ